MYDKGYLVLEDESVYEGLLIGACMDSVGEVVFNTSMTGYQEALTDPSYYGQIIMMTYPLIGNYGVNNIFNESDKSWVKGFVVNSICDEPSNWSSESSLNDFLIEKGITGLTDVDVRAITRKIRNVGTMRGIISKKRPDESQKKEMMSYEIKDAVKSVSTSEKYILKGDDKGSIALMDLGVKKSIIESLKMLQYDIVVYPALTPYDEILAAGHKGLVLSNGPGDPQECDDIIANLKRLIGKIPIWGICLGHQLLALAMGGSIVQLKYGHRGANHPIKDLKNDKVYLTSQNHGYAVENKEIRGGYIRSINLNDNTVEGICYPEYKAFSVQYYPEALAIPLDSNQLFNEFKNMIEKE